MKVVISGASSGIGLALAEILAMRGEQVFSLDIQPPLRESRALSHIHTDVSDEEALRAAFAVIGPDIDVIINNAAVLRREALFDSSSQDFDLLFRINVKGSWLVIKEARQHLVEKATILQMSSGHALNPPPNAGLYTWTKQSVLLLCEAVQRQYPNYRIKTTFLGPVDTPMSAVGRTAAELEEEKKISHSPEYAAKKIVQLLDGDHSRLLFDGSIWDYRFE